MSTVEKKVSRNRGDMISEVRYQLKELSDAAGRLAETLGEGNRPTSRSEKEVIKMVVDSRIRRIMDEATYFAIQGELEDMEKDMNQVKDWAMFKMDV